VCNMTPEEKRQLFEDMGAIKANQENIKENVTELKKEQKGLIEVVTGVRIKAAKDAGAVAVLITLAVSIAIKAMSKYFTFGGH